MRIYVLTIDGVFDLGLSAVLDTLSTANALAGAVPDGETARFDVQLVGVRRRVRTQHGLIVPVIDASSLRRPDVVVVPAIAMLSPDDVDAMLDRRDVADAGEALARWARRGSRVCAACGGTFLVASTSLLDGRSATTTWWLAPAFRVHFPSVELDETKMIVVSDNFITAGAALAHLDLALWLVRQSSPALANLVARYLLIDPRPSSSVLAIPDHLAHSDPIVEAFERWARESLSTPFSLPDAARAVGTSARTLSRRMQKVLGTSPVSYVQKLRVERAVHLLRTTDASVDDIAGQVGYADAVTLRTLLRRETGRGVRELRRDYADN